MKKLYLGLTQLLPEEWRNANRLRFYERLALWRWRLRRLGGLPRAPLLPDGAMRLHLGCGRLDVPGFVNVDARPYPHVHHLGSVETLPFIKDGTADLVYVSHCLEHIPYRRVPQVLKEWHRVLRPGGRLRLAVPDFEVLWRAYDLSGRELITIQPFLLGGQDYPQNFHFSVFDERLLGKLLREAGFEKARRWDPSVREFGEFTDCSTATVKVGEQEMPVSLNLEARRPDVGAPQSQIPE